MKTSEIFFDQEIMTEESFVEMDDLLQEHVKEISVFPDDVKLKPNIPLYVEKSKTSDLNYYTVRDKRKLVGYLIYFVGPHVHFMDMNVAIADAIYIHPNYRKGRLGIDFIKYTERHLRDSNIDFVIQSTKTQRNLSRMFEFLGYKIMDISMFKRL